MFGCDSDVTEAASERHEVVVELADLHAQTGIRPQSCNRPRQCLRSREGRMDHSDEQRENRRDGRADREPPRRGPLMFSQSDRHLNCIK